MDRNNMKPNRYAVLKYLANLNQQSQETEGEAGISLLYDIATRVESRKTIYNKHGGFVDNLARPKGVVRKGDIQAYSSRLLEGVSVPQYIDIVDKAKPTEIQQDDKPVKKKEFELVD